jgi:hypothetical protein
MARLGGWVRKPEGWRREVHRGPWPFITSESFHAPDGRVLRWDSRAHRKHQVDATAESTWWAPGAVGWWIGVLFALGSLCFLLGSFPPYADAVGEAAADTTFFVGSIWFTSAASLQFREAARAGAEIAPGAEAVLGRPRSRPTWTAARIDLWATSVQLAGTFAFNISTFMATRDGFDAAQTDHRVWAPDAVGSVCFLIASALAFAEVGHAWLSWHPRSLPWRIAASNLVGSIAFGASALGAYVIVDTGDLVNELAANAGTFIGAACFLFGALLLLPERTLASPDAAVDTSRGGPGPSR